MKNKIQNIVDLLRIALLLVCSIQVGICTVAHMFNKCDTLTLSLSFICLTFALLGSIQRNIDKND